MVAGTLLLTGSITSDVVNEATFALNGGTVTGNVTNLGTMTSDGISAVTRALNNQVTRASISMVAG